MNAFNVASHFFAILPITLAYAYELTYLFVLSLFTVTVSIAHHVYEENSVLTHIDEFFASALIFVAILVYIENAYMTAGASLILLGIIVYIDFFVDLDVVTIFVGVVLFSSFFAFAYEREFKHLKTKAYDIYSPYFISFVATQAAAAGFYLWAAYDTEEKYAHAFWHVLAFVSFASLIAHVSTRADEYLNRVLFYWLGSIPCRVFIAWVFIDWAKASWVSRVPVLILFTLLVIPIAIRGMRFFLINILYIAMLVCIVAGEMRAAGWLLLSSTVVSAISWCNKQNKHKSIVVESAVEDPTTESIADPIQVQNKRTLRF